MVTICFQWNGTRKQWCNQWQCQKFVVTIDPGNWCHWQFGNHIFARTKSFKFQEELKSETFHKADLRVVKTLKIPALTGVPVKLGTTIDYSQKSLQRYSCGFDHHFQHRFSMSVCSTWPSESWSPRKNDVDFSEMPNEDITIPRCSIIEYI